VRYFSVRALARRGIASAVPALARLVTEDTAPHVRIAAAEALAAIGGDEARAALVPLQTSSNPDLARVARDATGSTTVVMTGTC